MKTVIVLLALCSQAWACGEERWSVKTLADKGVSRVEFNSKRTTIEKLIDLTAPGDLHSNPDFRHQAETITWQVEAKLTGFKHEADGDYHLVLESYTLDPKTHKYPTMIAEIPDPVCVPASYRATFASERAWLQKEFGGFKGTGKMKKVPAGDQDVVVEGVGFFDFLHGQTGVAPNGIELHPVMSISRNRASHAVRYNIPIACVHRVELVCQDDGFTGCNTNLEWDQGCEMLEVSTGRKVEAYYVK